MWGLGCDTGFSSALIIGDIDKTSFNEISEIKAD